MPLSASQLNAADAYNLIRGTAVGVKQMAQTYVNQLQGGNVDPTFVFRVLDQTHSFISQMQSWQGISGLDAYATNQGYSGSMSADIGTCITAAQAMTAWVVNNFPTAGGYLQAESLNTDGSRTLRQFTPAQTAGWVTAINAFIATIN